MRAQTTRFVTGVTVATLIIALATFGGYRLAGPSSAGQGHVRLATTYPQTWLGDTNAADTHTSNGCQWVQPCITVQAAESVTSPGGEIIQHGLSPAGPGYQTANPPPPTNITEAITLNGAGSRMTMLDPLAGNDININAGPNDTVILRHVDLQGSGIGTNGIVVNTCKQLILDDVTISGFTGNGITFGPAATGMTVTIINSRINNNGQAGVAASTSSGTVHVNISHSSINNNYYGVVSGDGAVMDITDSVISGNTSVGLIAQTFGLLSSLVNTTRDQFENNPYAILETHGAGNAQIIIWLSDDDLVNNTNGIAGNTGGTLAAFSFGGNRAANDVAPGGVNGNAPQF